MSDSTPSEEFRAQVQRLVAEGKLTAEEAQGLLGEPDGREEGGVQLRPVQAGGDPAGTTWADTTWAATNLADTPPDLKLEVSGYTLQVVVDSQRPQPGLNVDGDGHLLLEATAQGWRVARHPDSRHGGWSNVRAILTVPFSPRHVNAEIHGGNLNLPDIGGEMLADVNGGNIRMGCAASLKADVNGGNLSATEVGGPTLLSVNGGNISLSGAHALNASVNGGNLRWAGLLSGGDHRLEVNAGNATLHLWPGSSVRVEADVTVGAFKADFPTHRHGSFVTTHHSGQLGAGEAALSCRVAAGQVKLVSA